MKSFKTITAIALSTSLLGTCLASNETPSSSRFISSAKQTKLSPEQVLHKLIQGNKRYMNEDRKMEKKRKIARLTSKKGQSPIAFIFNCVDSRSTPEFIFDQPNGALFVSRIAGNIINREVLGSMEFATQYAGTKLIVVMGHTQCGAIAGACSNVNKPENLHHLLQKAKPAVEQEKQKLGKKTLNCQDAHVIDDIATQNVINQMKGIVKQSPATAKLIKEGKIKLVGAMHNIQSGRVTFFNVNGKSIH